MNFPTELLLLIFNSDTCVAHTHEVHDQLAHADAEDEVLHEVGDEGEGDAHQGHHEVADGQREQEQVGDGPHPPVPHQHRDDEAVAQQAEEEDQAVEENPDGPVDVWETQTPAVRIQAASYFDSPSSHSNALTSLKQTSPEYS